MEGPPEIPTPPEANTNIESAPESPAEAPSIQESSPPVEEAATPTTAEMPSGPEDDSIYDAPPEAQPSTAPTIEAEDDSRYDVPPGIEDPLPETAEPPKDYDTVREAMLDTVKNQTLRNHLDALYRPGATEGDGGSADALITEKETGGTVGGKQHGKKVPERATGLTNLIAEGELDTTDAALAQNELEALQNAQNLPRKIGTD